YACESTVVGQTVVMDPHADLPGNRQFFVVATTALEDRAGNRLESTFQSGFTTIADTDPPSVLTAWPAMNATGISPLVQPTFTFDESMDPDTVEAASLLFQDEFGNIIPFAIDATADQRTLRVRPTIALQQNRSYTMAFKLGAAAATDVSGNQLTATQALTFRTGTDQAPPVVASSSPAPGETRVPGVLVAEVTFEEDLDAGWVDTTVVELLVDDAPWTSVVELVAGNTVRVTPVLTLPTNTSCTLVLRGGQDGLHDLAGNVPAADTRITFTTSADGELPEAMILPPDGAVSIAVGSRLTVVFDAPMDPATIGPGTILFTDDFGAPIAGSMQLSADDRVVTFTPDATLVANAYYRIRVVGGNTGPRRKTGNWFDDDRLSRFRTSNLIDGIAPTIQASINGIPEARRSGLVLPPSGWTIDVSTSDAQSQWVDMGSVEVELSGGFGPSPETLLSVAEVGYNTVVVQVPESAALSAGTWTMVVRARDLSGNLGQSDTIQFEVDNLSGGAMPFERTQVVWVRTDLDRDNNGRSDFADDMLRLGFATEGDPNGSNAWLERVLLDGILAKANALYKRGQRGEPLDASSVQLRFTTFEPIALPHMQMALGGLDPEGDRTRSYGQESTGVLGRAFYDYRNGNVTERNTSTSPGTGVFPAEMFLYQARIHQQVYPSFQTVFASKFLPLCPDMGGTPAGSDPLDAVVLQPGFDYENATGSQRARWNTVMAAMDDWAAVIGVILAHEVGHSVGLVAPGAMPNGLFGDSSLHDTFAGAAEVMAPSVGYEAMTTLDYQFRDIDLAYLRQRILLR
ncbi:MAG: Ig-like domain-containing protein, partial [Planctomycetes bacterium]|nr:Ig-like domain-containing protein [Planctomycetota bacterium]